MKGHLYRRGGNPPGSGPTNPGNGGDKNDSSAKFDIQDPQKIENYFENRQSQFGLPSNIPGSNVNNQPPKPVVK